MDSHPLFRDNAKKEFELKNGNLKSFTTKDIVILLHKETQEKIKDLDIKIEKHMGHTQREDTRIGHVLADHDKVMQHITGALPEKGFCERVTNALELDKKITLSDKVDLLWNDRRWVKYILLAVFALGGGNIIIQIM